jgi:hypothetical protein
VNVAARLEGVAKPGAICLSERAYWQVKGRLDLKVTDLGRTQLKNIAEPIHVYSLEVGQPVQAKPANADRADPAGARIVQHMGKTTYCAGGRFGADYRDQVNMCGARAADWNRWLNSSY